MLARVSLRIRQYAYFAIRSNTLSPEAMTQRIGLSSDKVTVMGSRRTDPPLPGSTHGK
jgi:hypothetical protein